MTIEFIKRMKAFLKCSRCSSSAMPERQFCVSHLQISKLKWRKHALKCKRNGRCINCNRKKLPQEQRCPKCKIKNRKRAYAWYIQHKIQTEQRYRERLARGLCSSCGKRRPVRNHVQCSTCHKKRYRT